MFSGDRMKKGRIRTLEETLALPSEAALNTPYVEIRGKKRVSIENHRGISEYTDDAIIINVKHGKIAVQGERLTIAGMNRRRIEVHGMIQAVIME